MCNSNFNLLTSMTCYNFSLDIFIYTMINGTDRTINSFNLISNFFSQLFVNDKLLEKHG